MNVSYWEKKSFFCSQDLIIVGCGIVGLSAAIHFKQSRPERSVLIVDGGIIPQGASTKNAGFACIGSAGELLSDMLNYDEENVFALVERRKKGLDLLRENLGDNAISYDHFGGYELFENDDYYAKIAEKIPYFNQKLSKITKNDSTFTIATNQISSFGLRGVKHLIKNNCEGQIDTGKMMYNLMNKARLLGVQILLGINTKEIIQNKLDTGVILNNGVKIQANNLLICTNGFAKTLLPELNVIPARAQVLVTSPIENLKIKGSFHYDEGFYYFRNIDNRILLGGGRNLDFEGERTTEFGNTPLIMSKLKEMLDNMIIPNQVYKIDYEWSGIMAFGENKSPIVKQVSSNIFCAVRLGGMGVAIGSLVGKEAVELMQK
ncbi:MAG TPA: FAD-binding oxidoreductase [Bacteroidia bacterium]|nr:FAD-binding oxidoreductase [Bacteroidia bacterium]